MGSHVFRKYVCQQLLIVGLEVLHFFLLLRRLQLPQEVQSAFVNKNVASYSPPIREGYRLNRISTFYFNFDIVANSSFAIPFFFYKKIQSAFVNKNVICSFVVFFPIRAEDGLNRILTKECNFYQKYTSSIFSLLTSWLWK